MLARSRRRLRRLKASAYATDIRTVATSATISQALLLACTPILTRLYSPSDFGLLAIFISILGIVPIIANLRYDVAISLSKNRQESFHTLSLCLISTCFCTALIAIVFASDLLANSTLGQIRPYWWLVALGTFAVGVFTALNAWAGYAQKFKLVAKVKIRQAVSSVVVQISLGLLTAGPIGLLVGYVISQSYGAFAFMLEVKRARPQKFGIRAILVAARKYRHFLMFAFPAGVINRLGIHIIPVLVGHYYSIAAAGFFLLAQRLVALPTLVIGRSVAQVYTNRLAKDSLKGGVKLLPTYLKTVFTLFLMGFVPMALLMGLAPWMFTFVFGDEWRDAGVYCQILVPAFYAQFVISPMIQTLNILGHQRVQLIWDCSRLVSIFAAFLIANEYDYSQFLAVGAISVTLCSTYVLQFFLSFWAIRRHDKAMIEG